MNVGDTIVAAATPFGYSGVAVIRLSGPGVSGLLEQTTSRTSYKNRVATLSDLISKTGETIDRSLVTFFASPRSYTGEDLAEISTHGNPSIVNEVLSLLIGLGARQADPGEFTYRAFINGKMDLVQAEAVASLVGSKSKENTRIQQKIISGDLSVLLNSIRSELLDLLSTLEHQMDISEEDLDLEYINHLDKRVHRIQNDVDSLLGTFKMGQLFNRGVRLVLSGPPNVGKSSLFNLIANDDRAIVSDQPGTTRDVIDLEILLSGVPVRIYDTAGIRGAENLVEKEGVYRAIQKRQSADIVLSVYDSPSAIPQQSERDESIIYILNKTDIHKANVGKGVIHISCKDGSGINALLIKIKEKIGVEKISTDLTYLSTKRQYSALTDCSRFLGAAATLCLGRSSDLEIISYELREAAGALDVLLGKTTAEDIINNIFNNLCVGK